MKNAIVMMCILNDKYITGAIINVLHQRAMLGKSSTVEFVIMVDSFINKNYNKLLSQYFDKVYLIDLYHIANGNFFKTVHKGYEKKYGIWMGYSTNKWQCLNLIEYDKVLFLDIDILPVDKKFYELFTFNTPAIHIHNQFIQKKCVSNSESVTMRDERITSQTFKQFIKNNKIEQVGSLDGGILLLKPNKTIFNLYSNFIKEEFKDSGLISFPNSGVDETSLYYFLHQIAKKERSKIYSICSNYAFVFWDKERAVSREESKGIYALNYLSFVKPWLKPITLCWKEEMIWHDLYKRFKLEKDNTINFLYIKGIFHTLVDIYWSEFSATKFDETHSANIKRNKERIQSNLFIKKLIKKETTLVKIPDDVLGIFKQIQKL